MSCDTPLARVTPKALLCWADSSGCEFGEFGETKLGKASLVLEKNWERILGNPYFDARQENLLR